MTELNNIKYRFCMQSRWIENAVCVGGKVKRKCRNFDKEEDKQFTFPNLPKTCSAVSLDL